LSRTEEQDVFRGERRVPGRAGGALVRRGKPASERAGGDVAESVGGRMSATRNGRRPLGGRDLYRAIFLLATIAAVGLFLRDILTFLMLFLITVLMALALAAGARLLGRARLPRAAGVLLTLLFLIGAFAALAYALMPPLIDQLVGLLTDLPGVLTTLRGWLRSDGAGIPPAAPALIAELERGISELLAALTFDPLSLVIDVVGLAKTAAGLAAVSLVLLVAAVYMAIKPGPLVEGFLRLVPQSGRERARTVLDDLRETLTRWIGGTVVAMATVGAMTTFALWVIGVPFPLLLGVLAGLLELVPFYGPVLAAIPAVVVALSESWVHAISVVGAIAVIQAIEGNLLIPLIMGRAIGLHPAVIALGILFVGWILGPLAVFVAVPILATARVLVNDLWIERVNEREESREGRALHTRSTSEARIGEG
jgi:predicted PurR-regulated permease PerM